MFNAAFVLNVFSSFFQHFRAISGDMTTVHRKRFRFSLSADFFQLRQTLKTKTKNNIYRMRERNFKIVVEPTMSRLEVHSTTSLPESEVFGAGASLGLDPKARA